MTNKGFYWRPVFKYCSDDNCHTATVSVISKHCTYFIFGFIATSKFALNIFAKLQTMHKELDAADSMEIQFIFNALIMSTKHTVGQVCPFTLTCRTKNANIKSNLCLSSCPPCAKFTFLTFVPQIGSVLEFLTRKLKSQSKRITAEMPKTELSLKFNKKYFRQLASLHMYSN